MQNLNVSNRKKEKYMMLSLLFLIMVTSIIDLITAFLGPHEIAEINPIYLLTGNFWILMVINFLVMFWFIKSLYQKISLPKIFFLVIILLFLSFAHIFGAYSNIKATRIYDTQPEAFEAYYETTTTSHQYYEYFKIVSVIMIIPIFLSLISFMISYKIFEWRQPKRELIVEEIIKLSKKLEE